MPPKKKKLLVRFRPRLQDERRWQDRFAAKELASKLAESDKGNLVPRVLSYPPYGARESKERETLENDGHVSPRIWEITRKRFGGGAGKCEICLYRASVQPWNCVPDLIWNAENNTQSPLTAKA